MLAGDLRYSESMACMLITLRREKGKAQRKRMRTLTIPADAVPMLTRLLFKWEQFRGPLPASCSYWKLHSEQISKPFAPTMIDKWLRDICGHLGVSPPPNESWSGHSARKGAATAAHAIDVFLTKICFMGGWSVHSAAVHDYIDPTCIPSQACWDFFGWLRAKQHG